MPDSLEIVAHTVLRGSFHAVVFDFDGTLSLLREGWARIMAELGREQLAAQNLQNEPDTELLPYLEREMLMLSGRPSLVQMQRLAEEVRLRGGTPPDADELLRTFLQRLTDNIRHRIADLESGAVPPSAWLVPGTHELLDTLQQRGVKLFLASGTDRVFVEADLRLLDLTRYFGSHVYTPSADMPNFHKRDVIAMILQEEGIPGEKLLGFGDGYSETVEVKRVGGLAIGVASSEPPIGRLNTMKRQMLLELGADAIIPDYRNRQELLAWLWPASH